MMPAGRIGHGDVRLPGKDERADMQQYLPLIIIVISMLVTVGGMIFLLNAGRD